LLKIIRKEAGNRPIYLEAADTRPAVKFYTKLNFEDLGGFEVGGAVFNAMKLEPTTKSLLDEDTCEKKNSTSQEFGGFYGISTEN